MATASEAIDLERELDRLYGSPAKEFVANRNQLAKRLRGVGDAEAAGHIRRLAKPSLTAWAVNQLAFRAAGALDGLMAAGERVRSAHLAGPDEQRAAAKERREAIATLRTIAEVALQEAGARPTRAHRQRISRTLEALSSRAADSAEPRAGRLSTDLEPAGFDALTDLAEALAAAQKARPKPAGVSKSASHPARDAGKRRFEPKEARVAEHPATQSDARRAREEARREAEHRQLNQRREQARARLELLEGKASELRREAERAASALERAVQSETVLEQTARDAERLAREARARADDAAGATAKARRDSEAAAAALSRIDSEADRARTELEQLDSRRGI